MDYEEQTLINVSISISPVWWNINYQGHKMSTRVPDTHKPYPVTITVQDVNDTNDLYDSNMLSRPALLKEKIKIAG